MLRIVFFTNPLPFAYVSIKELITHAVFVLA